MTTENHKKKWIAIISAGVLVWLLVPVFWTSAPLFNEKQSGQHITFQEFTNRFASLGFLPAGATDISYSTQTYHKDGYTLGYVAQLYFEIPQRPYVTMRDKYLGLSNANSAKVTQGSANYQSPHAKLKQPEWWSPPTAEQPDVERITIKTGDYATYWIYDESKSRLWINFVQ